MFWNIFKPREVSLPWMVEIDKVMGLHETKDNKVLSAWLRSDGHTLGDPAKLPWCGDAVETAVRLGLPGERFPKVLEGNPYWARNWAQFGQPCGLVYGAIVSFVRGSSGHVAFLVGVSLDGKQLRIRGGNQSNMINDIWIDASRLLASRWPLSVPTSSQRPAPKLRFDGSELSRNEA